MHVANVFYQEHSDFITSIEQQALAQCPGLTTLNCMALDDAPEELRDFIHKKTPTALKAYITGTLMRSWVASKRSLGATPANAEESHNDELLYALGVTLSRIGSYTMHSNGHEEDQKKVDAILLEKFMEFSKKTGVPAEITRFNDGGVVRKSIISPE